MEQADSQTELADLVMKAYLAEREARSGDSSVALAKAARLVYRSRGQTPPWDGTIDEWDRTIDEAEP